MRNTLVACSMLALSLGLPAPAHAASRAATAKPHVREPQPMPVPKSDAGQGRRRAVRKTTPAGPVARADAYTVRRGNTLVVAAAAGVLANDTDPQSKPLTAILVSTTAQGAITLQADGSFQYVHGGSAASSDSFTYKANNGTVDTATVAVTIAITDAPPQALNDAYAAGQDAPLSVPAPGVLANDVTNNAAIASYGVNGAEQSTIGGNTNTAQGGSVSLAANGGFAYTPANGFTGNDAFRYVLTNSGGSANAQVSVTVTPPAPVAANDFLSATQGTQLNVTAPGILGNDTLHGALLSGYGAASGAEQSSIGAPTPTSAGGTIRVNADGSFRYDPAGNFSGSDTFKYAVTNATATVTATVTITVSANNSIDFTVTSPGFNYQFSGVSGLNPVLTLTRGRTYRFRITTSAAHPFEILDAPPGSVTNNNIFDGILIFAVPAAGNDYRYHCSIHEFGNSINTTP
jgi:hypothetical protein